jgi:hypothetical protein
MKTKAEEMAGLRDLLRLLSSSPTYRHSIPVLAVQFGGHLPCPVSR